MLTSEITTPNNNKASSIKLSMNDDYHHRQLLLSSSSKTAKAKIKKNNKKRHMRKCFFEHDTRDKFVNYDEIDDNDDIKTNYEIVKSKFKPLKKKKSFKRNNGNKQKLQLNYKRHHNLKISNRNDSCNTKMITTGYNTNPMHCCHCACINSSFSENISNNNNNHHTISRIILESPCSSLMGKRNQNNDMMMVKDFGIDGHCIPSNIYSSYDESKNILKILPSHAAHYLQQHQQQQHQQPVYSFLTQSHPSTCKKELRSVVR